MTYLKTYLRTDVVNVLKNRGRAFASMMDDTDLSDIISACIRKLDETLTSPRDLIITQYSKVVDLSQEGVDEICTVFFSGNTTLAASPVGAEVGLLPFIMRGAGMANFSNVIEFLQMKATLNIMNRQLRTAPDYEYRGGKIYFNIPFGTVDIEYLPYLDGNADQWDFYQMEYDYFIERCWCMLNLRNAEAQMSAVTLGLGEKAI